MENMSARQRLRAAVCAGNSTALVELCLHLQDQVTHLSAVVLAQHRAAEVPPRDYGSDTAAEASDAPADA